ncbi:P-loop containing nucleoside triphosphate hydrolase protein [Irpex rosettiformis]|uniref:P-loop containing nucleoside triphosphate hydrolase protein n=1 Tax=Irpex rosettiformis TaxID=378272 RepID=A0ACB8TS56_9APHY|nr:P-loop containing nucleoside triphosphate hydrolase protein [Irpex rosettiformis]
MSGDSTTTNGHARTNFQPIFIVVMGVASTGKSTIAKALNDRLGLPYIEGDDMHPKSNIDKMSQGIPLTDADREPWLELIRTTAENIVAEQEVKARGEDTMGEEGAEQRTKGRYGVMATSSALKKYYRDILRGTYKGFSDVPGHLHAIPSDKLPTYFVYIKAEESLLRERMAKREGHFMKTNMLDSQLATLESPEGEENVVVVPLDATTEDQVRIAIEGLEKLVGDLKLVPTHASEENNEPLDVKGEHIM